MSTMNNNIAPRRQNLAPSPSESAGSPIAISVGPKSNGRKIEPDAEKKGLTQIITSKEWVLPPRPKPGRKPSVDTPASKRKAQNRAAQRAFRERRATRVQELEEQLLEVEKERDVKEMGLINTINKMKMENQFLLKTIEQMRSELNSLKDSNQIHSQAQTPQYSISQFKLNYTNTVSPTNQSIGSPASSSYSIQQVSPAPSSDSPPFSGSNKTITTNNSNFTPISNDTSPDKQSKKDFDCGVCYKDECLCETVGLKDKKDVTEVDFKSLEQTLNSFKPIAAVSLKKRKQSSETEIDFTQKFAINKSIPDLKKLKKSSSVSINLHASPEKKNINDFDESSPVENCGFCSDDTPCVCREAAREAARLNQSLIQEESIEEESKTSLPPIQLNSTSFAKAALPVMHPGPSVEIREITNLTPGAVPNVTTPTTRGNGSIFKNENDEASIPAEAPKKSGCTGNPGTCEQCQMDPMSTLFCTTVASKKDVSSESTSSVDSPNIRPDSRASISSTSATTPSQSSSIFIPCSDAYKTLSRHKKFNSVDFSTLVGKLTTRGMQVEVQSVANVLRELDRRLYN